MKPIERLAHYFKDNKIKFSVVERQAGIGNGYLSRQIKNQASIGSDILEKICNCYPSLNATWLLTGKGLPDLFVDNSSNPSFADTEHLTICQEQVENLSKQVELLKREIRLLNDIIQLQRNKNGE